MSHPSVLFVCTANICRSPMAAALFQVQLSKVEPAWKTWKVDSAGTWASDGQPASDYSCQIVAKYGIDISRHRSKTVTRELLDPFDLILTMEAGQKEAIQVEFPHLAKRVFMLSEMQGNKVNVQDPYGGSLASYERAEATIVRMLTNGIDRIRALVAEQNASPSSSAGEKPG